MLKVNFYGDTYFDGDLEEQSECFDGGTFDNEEALQAFMKKNGYIEGEVVANYSIGLVTTVFRRYIAVEV